ncbi:phosphopantetheinyl transferase [Paenibacillus mucilaginosus 3016]|uniref:Phosphopantetheinyl transferase n=1 Tax=Paenibacillus mucilaginosus 3016 TaxID=1116391 RepID=H6NLE0_9BACL|nr:4'-phosphopantetheinyl transferase superfamily protein [Paenibacillus mucilaginosus]AFC30322.1 phosphopantetheinyl transferase [Paenibacillus mucilaginosus 3016]WFA18959.1 4'-phosphopantetheinyl transferase superfamily protein [Paenibacillus mucilaginosus]
MFRITAVHLGSFPADTPEGDELYTSLLAFVPVSKREKLGRFRHRQDALRSLTGELLARDMASEALGTARSAVELAANPYGKPYVKDAPSFHFNVSHAGGWVVCAAGGAPIGADVEREAPLDASLPAVVLTEPERMTLEAVGEAEGRARFYRYWTAKESFVKQLGTGLSTDPLTITITDPDGDSGVLWNGVRQPCRVYRWQLDAEHPLAVCSTESPAPGALQCVEASGWLAAYGAAAR